MLTVLTLYAVGAPVLAAAAAAPTAPAPPTAPKAAGQPGALVIIGTGGFSVNDLAPDATPTLWQLFREGAAAVTTARSGYSTTCPIDGWLSLSAGAPTGAVRPGPAGSDPAERPCPPIPTPALASSGTATRVPDWTAYQEAARTDKAQLGLLGQALAERGTCVQAIGPGAAAAAAQPDGAVARYAAWSPDTLLATLAACPVSIVDVGGVRGPGNLPAGEIAEGTREAQLSAIDARIGAVLEAGPNGADYLITSMSDAGTVPRLRLAIARGPRFGPGTLESTATRQPGLIVGADVAATAVWLESATLPEGMTGRPLTVVPAIDASDSRARERVDALVDLELSTQRAHTLVGPFFFLIGGAAVLGLLVGMLAWRLTRGRLQGHQRLHRLARLERVATLAAGVPVATFLISLLPWWRAPRPIVWLIAGVLLLAGALAWVAHWGRWGRRLAGPTAVVCAVTAAVIGVDVVAGSRLQLISLMGLQPVGGGRYFGMGNVSFALFGSAVLLLAAILAGSLLHTGRRGLALAVVGGLGAVAVLVDGAPFWGADAGGPPALVVGVAVLLFAVHGGRPTLRRLAIVGVVGVGLVALLAVLDWLRPVQERTHLGAFVQRVVDGTAWEVIADKGRANLAVLLGADQALAPLVPVVVLALLYAVWRPQSRLGRPLAPIWARRPSLRSGMLAVLALLIVAALINDSSVAIAAAAGPLVLPLLVSLRLRVAALDERASAPSRSARRGEPRPAAATTPSPPTRRARAAARRTFGSPR